jgi:hypothetical protein
MVISVSRYSATHFTSVRALTQISVMMLLALHVALPGQHRRVPQHLSRSKCLRPDPGPTCLHDHPIASRLLPSHLTLRGGGEMRASTTSSGKKQKHADKPLGPGKLLDRKTLNKKTRAGKVSIKEAFMSNLRVVTARKGILEEYQRKYHPDGEKSKETGGPNGKHSKSMLKKKMSKSANASFSVNGDAVLATRKTKIASSGGSSSRLQASADDDDHETKETRTAAEESHTTQAQQQEQTATSRAGQASSSSNTTKAYMHSKNFTVWVWNASSVHGILSELNRTGLCMHKDLDQRVRSFMARLQKQGRRDLLLNAVKEFRDHLSRPMSDSRRVRNKCAVLTNLLHTAMKNAPSPIRKHQNYDDENASDTQTDTVNQNHDAHGDAAVQQTPPKETYFRDRTEEQVRWNTMLQWGVHVHNDVDATAQENSTYMQRYPTVVGRRVFTCGSAPVEIVLRVKKMSRMMFIGVLTRNSTIETSLTGGLTAWWGDQNMTNKAWYIVSNGRALNGGRVVTTGAPQFGQNDIVIARLELAEGRVTFLRGNEDATCAGVLHAFYNVREAVRLAVQFKEQDDCVRLLHTRPYIPTQNPDTSGGDGVMGTDIEKGVNASVGGADDAALRNDSRCAFVSICLYVCICIYMYACMYMYVCIYSDSES